MIIEQTVEILPDYRVSLELPRSVPVGVKVRVQIDIPSVPDGTVRSFRGILKDRGITLERFREIQREDKMLEDAGDERLHGGIR